VNCNASDKKGWVYARKILSGLPIIWETIKISTGSHCIPEDCMVWFQDHNSWAVWFMSPKRLALHVATTLTQKLPTKFLEKLSAYLCHIIHLHQKHHYLLEETPVFFNMPTNTIIDVKWPKSICVKTTGHEKLRTRMLSIVADGKNWHCLLF